MLSSQLHVDLLLSEISVKYRQTEFIADQVFPILPVKKESNLYRVFTKNIKIPETRRANKAASRQYEMEVTTSSYVLERHALSDIVSDEDTENYDISDLRADVTENLTDAMLRRREKTVADVFTSTSWSLGVSLAAAGQFSLQTTASNPILIFETAATTIISNSSMKPNYAIVPRPGFLAIKNHVSIVDRVKYTNVEVTEKIIGALLSMENFLVPVATYDTAHDGLAEVVSDIWADIAFVGYKPGRPSPLAASAGYIFERAMPRVKKWRVEEKNGEQIEVNMQFVPKVVASLCGYLIKDLV